MRNSLDSIESNESIERKRQDPADDGVEFVTFVTIISKMAADGDGHLGMTARVTLASAELSCLLGSCSLLSIRCQCHYANTYDINLQLISVVRNHLQYQPKLMKNDVLCHSLLPDAVLCYAGILQQTCSNTSAADINAFIALVYNVMWSLRTDCDLG